MQLIKEVVSNGYMAILHIIVWNISLTSKLPEAFHPKSFNSNIPLTITIGENIFRFIIFLLPLFIRLNITQSINIRGLAVYLLGVALYFESWLVVIFTQASAWSDSMLGFTAPSYTPIIWLTGLSLLVDSYYMKIVY